MAAPVLVAVASVLVVAGSAQPSSAGTCASFIPVYTFYNYVEQGQKGHYMQCPA